MGVGVARVVSDDGSCDRSRAISVALRTRAGAVRARTVAICHLKALIVTAPEGLRGKLRRERDLLGRCSRLRTGPAQSPEHRATVCALRCTARRALTLEAEASELESELEQLVLAICRALLGERGVGTISAAELINAWSHPGRIRSESAFAMIAGAAPIGRAAPPTRVDRGPSPTFRPEFRVDIGRHRNEPVDVRR